MLKKFLIFIVLLFAIIGLIILFYVKKYSLVTNFKLESNKEPMVIVEDFIIYNYKFFKINYIFSAKIGYFTEPNIVNFFVYINATRYNQKYIENLSSESAKITLDIENYEELFKKTTKVVSIDFEDNVKFNIGKETLEVNNAFYNSKTNKIWSNSEVYLVGKGKNIKSNKGFEYHLLTEELVMKGDIEGVIYELKSNK